MSKSNRYNTYYPLGYYTRQESRSDGSAIVHYERGPNTGGCLRLGKNLKTHFKTF